jgi:hypothetical protein
MAKREKLRIEAVLPLENMTGGSERANETLLHLACLIGRQIAREAFNLTGGARHPGEVSIEHVEAGWEKKEVTAVAKTHAP